MGHLIGESRFYVWKWGALLLVRGYGVHVKPSKGHEPLFSERYGYRKAHYFGPVRIEFMRPRRAPSIPTPEDVGWARQALDRQVEEWRKDADRYRWLRDRMTWGNADGGGYRWFLPRVTSDRLPAGSEDGMLDAAIDACIDRDRA